MSSALAFDTLTLDLTAHMAPDEEWLAILRHELASPVLVLRTAMELLDRAGVRRGPGGRAVEMVRRQTRQIERMLEDLALCPRIGVEPLGCRLAPLDLVRLVRQTFADREPELERSGLTPILQAPDQEITVLGDADRLAQVLDNLLSNARRFTAPGGLVGIEVVPVGSDVRLTVSDTGQGIAPERLTEIFDPFVRGESGRERGSTGQGLGLAIASRIVRSHGGCIEAHSPGAGCGASFVVHLPARRLTEDDRGTRGVGRIAAWPRAKAQS